MPNSSAQNPLFEAKGSTPTLAHISWNCDLKAGFLLISFCTNQMSDLKFNFIKVENKLILLWQGQKGENSETRQ